MYSETEAQYVYNLSKFPSLLSLLYTCGFQQGSILYSTHTHTHTPPGGGDL